MTRDFLLNAFATLFVTVDPLSLPPIFLALTHGMSDAERRQVAVWAAGIAFLVLSGFALGGHALLAALDVSLAAFRIAGGLFLFWTAFEMVFERRQTRRTRAAGRALAVDRVRNVAAFPLAIPLIAGPGAITAAMLLSARAQGDPATLAALIAIIAAVLACVLASAMLASRLDRLLGDTGRIVITRLLGIVLGALAVQFVADGVLELVRAAPPTR